MDRREGFEAMFRTEYPGLLHELALILGDPIEAEDVAADAFTELWRRWTDVKDMDRPGAWVRRVALRKSSRVRWRRGRRNQVEASFSPAASTEGRDLDLEHALAQLSEAQRIAVVMHHIGGWRVSDIAPVLGCTDATVRSHLLRGRQRLAQLLCDEDADEEVRDVKPG
jgi:RNA polymerase sigma-70 factor, ECF subfamily